MKAETMVQLAQNTNKYNRLYAKQVWTVVISFVLVLLFLGWFVKEICMPKVNPELVVGGLFVFVSFLVIGTGIWLLMKRGIKKIEEDRKLIYWQDHMEDSYPKRKTPKIVIIKNQLVLQDGTICSYN